jgi:hypothetical protein
MDGFAYEMHMLKSKCTSDITLASTLRLLDNKRFLCVQSHQHYRALTVNGFHC